MNLNETGSEGVYFIYKLHLEYLKLFDFGLQCRDLINQ